VVTYDIALVEEGDKVVVHAADCPMVRRLAQAGTPVATFFGCAKLPDWLPHAPCVAGLKHAGT